MTSASERPDGPPWIDVATRDDREGYDLLGDLWEVVPRELAVTAEKANPFTDGPCYTVSDIAGGVSWGMGWVYTRADGSFDDDFTRAPAGPVRDPGERELWYAVVDEYRAREAANPGALRPERGWQELPGGYSLRFLPDGGYLLVSPDNVHPGWRQHWRWQRVCGASALRPAPVAPAAREGGLWSPAIAQLNAYVSFGADRSRELGEIRAAQRARAGTGHPLTAWPGPAAPGGAASWHVTDDADPSWALDVTCTEDELAGIFDGGRLRFGGRTPDGYSLPCTWCLSPGHRPGTVAGPGDAGIQSATRLYPAHGYREPETWHYHAEGHTPDGVGWGISGHGHDLGQARRYLAGLLADNPALQRGEITIAYTAPEHRISETREWHASAPEPEEVIERDPFSRHGELVNWAGAHVAETGEDNGRRYCKLIAPLGGPRLGIVYAYELPGGGLAAEAFDGRRLPEVPGPVRRAVADYRSGHDGNRPAAKQEPGRPSAARPGPTSAPRGRRAR